MTAPRHFGGRYFGPRYFGPRYFGTARFEPWAEPSNLEEALIEVLTGSAPLEALIGDRVRPDYFPETDPRPAISYEVLSDLGDHSLKGPLGTATARVQFVIAGDTKADCVRVRMALANRFNGYRGKVGQVFIIRAKQSDRADSYTVRDDGSDEVYHLIEVEFTVRYSAPLPTYL